MDNVDDDPASKPILHRLLNRLLRRWRHRPMEAPTNRAELLELLRGAHKNALLDGDDLAMMEGVLQVSEMRARDIMLPRSRMTVVERDAAPEQFLPLLIDSTHSRFPVIGDSRDDVVGILLAKDVLHWFAQTEREPFRMRDLLRPAIFVPESKRLNVLLREFRANHNHLAIVVNEYQGVAGMLTIEDVLEQIVGDIEDEHDTGEEALILRHSPVRHTVKAMTPIDEFNAYFDADLRAAEADTVGGLLIERLERLPTRGEALVLDRFRFKVLRADSRRIYLLQTTVLHPPDEPAEAS